MIAFYSLVCFLCLGRVLSDSVTQTLYESMTPSTSTMSSLHYPRVDISGQNDYNTNDMSTESTISSTSKSSESTTVLTAVQFYQTNWCKRMLRPSAPTAIPDSLKLPEFEEKYVIPGYRALWYRSCYLPHRSANIASTIGGRVMGFTNSMIHRIIGTANTVFDTESDVIRDMLVRPQ